MVAGWMRRPGPGSSFLAGAGRTATPSGKALHPGDFAFIIASPGRLILAQRCYWRMRIELGYGGDAGYRRFRPMGGQSQ